LESSLSRRSRDLFTNKEYTKIYTKCYDMCTQRSPYNWSKDLYTRHSAAIKDYLMKTVMPSFNGKHNVHLLNELVKRWKNHRLMNRWMQKFFMYLDRYYVKHHTVPKLNEAGMNLFKEQVFDNIKSDVVEAALEQILKERNGEDVDRSRLAVSIKVFEDMGMGKMTVYEKEFEGDLLKATSLFYKGKSQVWIASDTTPEYLKKAERALRDEDERVKHYLNPSTAPKLLRNVEIELLKEYEMVLLNKEGSGCRALLKGDRKEDLKRMCELFSRPGVCSRCRSLPPSFSLSLSHSLSVFLSLTLTLNRYQTDSCQWQR
jgi:cullin 1